MHYADKAFPPRLGSVKQNISLALLRGVQPPLKKDKLGKTQGTLGAKINHATTRGKGSRVESTTKHHPILRYTPRHNPKKRQQQRVTNRCFLFSQIFYQVSYNRVSVALSDTLFKNVLSFSLVTTNGWIVHQFTSKSNTVQYNKQRHFFAPHGCRPSHLSAMASVSGPVLKSVSSVDARLQRREDNRTAYAVGIKGG